MSKSYRTSIDIDGETREQIITLLNQQLADTFDLYSQTKQAHWNVKGSQFFTLHELFDQLAAGLLGHVDTIAERATALGGLAMGTARMSAAASRLTDFPADVVESGKVLEAMVSRYAELGASTRTAIDKADELGDADTADLFTGVSRDIDKGLWFMEAHLQA